VTARAARLLRRRAEVARELAALDEAVAAELGHASVGAEATPTIADGESGSLRAPRCKPRPEDLERVAKRLQRAGVYPARR
jgi:hypothetical protein